MYRGNAVESLGTQVQVRRQCPEEHCSAVQRALHDDSREHRSESSAFTLDDLALTSHGAQVDYHDQNHFRRNALNRRPRGAGLLPGCPLP